MDKIASEFTTALDDLIICIVAKDKHNYHLLEIQDKFRIGRRELGSEEIIKMVGPHLWEHRANIKVRNEEFFIVLEIPESEGFNIGELLNVLRNIHSTLLDDEKKAIWNLVDKMLRQYIKFLKARRAGEF